MQSQARIRRVREEASPDSDPLHDRIVQIRSIQTGQGDKACFLTDDRLFCGNHGCAWRKECCRLIAVWKR